MIRNGFSHKIKIPCRNQVSTCLLNIEWWNILAEIRSYCKHQDIIICLEAFVLHSNKTLHFHKLFCPTSQKVCKTNGTEFVFFQTLDQADMNEWQSINQFISARLYLGDLRAASGEPLCSLRGAFVQPPGNLRATSGQPLGNLLGSLRATSGQPLGNLRVASSLACVTLWARIKCVRFRKAWVKIFAYQKNKNLWFGHTFDSGVCYCTK